MILEPLLASLAYFVCYGGNILWGQCMSERPIVVGFVTGLLLGDVTTGLVMGAALEAIFMGAVNIGGNISAEPAAATAFSVYMAVTQGLDVDAALALAVPIAMLSAFVFTLVNNVAMTFQCSTIDKFAENDDMKGMFVYYFGSWFVRFLIPTIIFFVGILLGSTAVQTFVDSIPLTVLNGLTVAGKLLPAVGLSILMSMVWQKSLVAYFFLGFVMFQYLGLPHVAIVVIAATIVVAICQRDFQLLQLQKSGINSATTIKSVEQEEEEFFQ